MDKNDIVDIVAQVLAAYRKEAAPERISNNAMSPAPDKSYKTGFFAKHKYIEPYTTLKNKRPFISEHDLKCMLKENPREIIVPKNAIISPLALEIIQDKNIKVNYGL